MKISPFPGSSLDQSTKQNFKFTRTIYKEIGNILEGVITPKGNNVHHHTFSLNSPNIQQKSTPESVHVSLKNNTTYPDEARRKTNIISCYVKRLMLVFFWTLETDRFSVREFSTCNVRLVFIVRQLYGKLAAWQEGNLNGLVFSDRYYR